MRRIFTILVILMLGLLISSCSCPCGGFYTFKSSPAPAASPCDVCESGPCAPAIITTQHNLRPFHAVEIKGPIHVQLDSRCDNRDYSVRLTGNQKVVDGMYIKVKNGILYITTLNRINYGQDRCVTVYISTNYLDYFGYYGSGVISGKIYGCNLKMNIRGNPKICLSGCTGNTRELRLSSRGDISLSGIKSRCLDVYKRGAGRLSLSGEIGLYQLQNYGTGNITIYWIDSPRVRVRSPQCNRSAIIFLGGVTGLIDAEIAGSTVLDAKYLRARKGFINTMGRSIAEVVVSDSLNAFASDNSNIYYFTQPNIVSKYMRQCGSVLYMGNAVPPCCTPFCPPVPCEPG